MLMDEDFEEMDYQDSTTTKIRDVLPRGGKRFLFEYEYDFGDSWQHEVLFEGCPRAEPAVAIPSASKASGRARPKTSAGPRVTRISSMSLQRVEDSEDHEDSLKWIGGRLRSRGIRRR